MRIAIVAPPWFELPPRGYGGIEWMCFWLAQGLSARGHDVTVIGAGRSRVSGRFVATYDVAPSARLGDPFPEVLHAARVARALRSIQTDLVHDHTLAGPLLAFERPVPTVVTAHGPITGETRDYFTALGDSVSLVAISHSQRGTNRGLPWAATIHNGIPVAEYPFRTEKDGFAIFLGRMNPEKGAHLAIDAARAADCPIVIAAKCNEPPEQAYFRAEVLPRIGPGAHWIGEADHQLKKDLLSRARCLVFPIQWPEPFGIVMVEAMACGTPVVALKAGSVTEIVVDGVTGFVCERPEELPEAIKAAHHLDPAKCRDRATAFDIDRMVSRYEDVYLGAIEHRAALDLAMRTGGPYVFPDGLSPVSVAGPTSSLAPWDGAVGPDVEVGATYATGL